MTRVLRWMTHKRVPYTWIMGVWVQARPDWIWGDAGLVGPTVYRREQPRSATRLFLYLKGRLER